jgi:hypothetical protein
VTEAVAGCENTHRVAGGRTDQTGTLSATLGKRLPHPLLFVKLEIKVYGLNGLGGILTNGPDVKSTSRAPGHAVFASSARVFCRSEICSLPRVLFRASLTRCRGSLFPKGPVERYLSNSRTKTGAKITIDSPATSWHILSYENANFAPPNKGSS